MLESDGQSTVPTHRVTGQAVPLRVAGEIIEDRWLQFLHEVVIHLVVLRPRLLGGVEVEAGSQSEIVITIRVIGHALATRARVGRNQHDAELGRVALRPAFHHEVLFSAGEPRKKRQDRDLAVGCLGWDEYRKLHVAVIGVGSMAVETHPAAKAIGFTDCFYLHYPFLRYTQLLWSDPCPCEKIHGMWRRMPACLLLIAIAATALPSCGRYSGVNETETPPASPAVLRRGNGGDPQTLDPAKADDVHSFRVLTDLFEGLVTLDASGNVVAGAAEKWELSENGLTYTFQLRQDLVWSNGEELTADHFVAGFKRTLAPEVASTYGFLLHSVRNADEVALGNLPASSLGVSAPDSQTLVIELDAPAPHFLAVLAMPVAFPFLADSLSELVSNGPFLLDDWTPGHRIRLQKNPLFHDADSVHIDTVEYYAIQDLLSELNMYRAGELDITASVPGANVGELRVSRDSELQISPSLAIYYLAFDLSEAPFDDIALRQALSMAIDRRALVNVIGRGEQPAYGLVPDGVSAYTPSRYDWQSLGDTERENEARRVFKSSPHYGNDSLRLTLTYDTDDIHEKIALAVSSMWRDVLGIEVELDKREWQYFLETRGNRDEWQIMRFAWAGDYNHASTFTDIFLSASPQNLPGYQSPRFDSLVAAALAEQDTSIQAQLLATAETEMLSDYPIAPLYFYVSKHLVSPAVHGFEQNILDRHPSRYMRLSQPLPSKSVN